MVIVPVVVMVLKKYYFFNNSPIKYFFNSELQGLHVTKDKACIDYINKDKTLYR